MLFFVLFVGMFNNALFAKNETGLEIPTPLYVSSSTTITISDNIIISENFKNSTIEFSNNRQAHINSLYIFKGTPYSIDSSNKHLQLIETNSIQNSITRNTTIQKNSLTHTTTSVALPKAKSSLTKLPFGKNNSYYFSKSTTSIVPTTQNQYKRLKKLYLHHTRFNLLFFSRNKTITSYNNNNIISSSAFCSYNFSLPPPSSPQKFKV